MRNILTGTIALLLFGLTAYGVQIAFDLPSLKDGFIAILLCALGLFFAYVIGDAINLNR